MLWIFFKSWLKWLLLDIALFIRGELRPAEKNLVNWFKVVGGLKCYLIAGLIQDFEISRKSGQCLLVSEGFLQSYDVQTSPGGSRRRQSLCRGVHGEKEPRSTWDVLAWESFSRELVLVIALGLHKSCTSQGRDICMAWDLLLGCKLEEAAECEASGRRPCS